MQFWKKSQHAKSRSAPLSHTSFDVMFSRSWNVMMLRSLALMRHSVLSRSVGLHIMSQYVSAAVWMKISITL